jgi:hypothetical protein
MLSFLIKEGLYFTIRIPANRIVTTEKGSYQLAEHPELQLQRNQKYKTIYASYKGLFCYFTAHKRKGQKGRYEVVFIVSNVKRTPKGHVKAYAERWPGEKCFRTGKQHIGLTHCQSRNADKQKFHVFCVMVSYAVLQLMKIDQKKQSVEEVLHPIRRQKVTDHLFEYLDLEATIMN